MNNEQQKVWDRLKHGIGETDLERLRRAADEHFNSEAHKKWRDDLNKEYAKGLLDNTRK